VRKRRAAVIVAVVEPKHRSARLSFSQGSNPTGGSWAFRPEVHHWIGPVMSVWADYVGRAANAIGRHADAIAVDK
jgi:hypothetical protein